MADEDRKGVGTRGSDGGFSRRYVLGALVVTAANFALAKLNPGSPMEVEANAATTAAGDPDPAPTSGTTTAATPAAKKHSSPTSPDVFDLYAEMMNLANRNTTTLTAEQDGLYKAYAKAYDQVKDDAGKKAFIKSLGDLNDKDRDTQIAVAGRLIYHGAFKGPVKGAELIADVVAAVHVAKDMKFRSDAESVMTLEDMLRSSRPATGNTQVDFEPWAEAAITGLRTGLSAKIDAAQAIVADIKKAGTTAFRR